MAARAGACRGRPGYRDIDGLVLVDGGLLGSFASADLARARRELADIRSGNVFLDILGVGLPEINGIFAQVGALWAYKRPDEPSVLQEYAPLPAFLKPPMRVTNEAQFGYAFDASTSPAALALIHIRAGRLAARGDPRGRRRPRRGWRPPARRAGAHPEDACRRRPPGEPPRPALGRPAHEPLPQDGGAVPEARRSIASSG